MFSAGMNQEWMDDGPDGPGGREQTFNGPNDDPHPLVNPAERLPQTGSTEVDDVNNMSGVMRTMLDLHNARDREPREHWNPKLVVDRCLDNYLPIKNELKS